MYHLAIIHIKKLVLNILPNLCLALNNIYIQNTTLKCTYP